MAYTVRVRVRQGPIIEEHIFDELVDAIEEADYAGYAGSRPVEVSVVDGDGVEHHRREYHAQRS